MLNVRRDVRPLPSSRQDDGNDRNSLEQAVACEVQPSEFKCFSALILLNGTAVRFDGLHEQQPNQLGAMQSLIPSIFHYASGSWAAELRLLYGQQHPAIMLLWLSALPPAGAGRSSACERMIFSLSRATNSVQR
eukprot:scaffold334231_cov34-Prasinocladus_malaysianus.AAC.1